MAAARAAAGPSSPDRAYAVGLARAFAGAIVFSLPLLMTMEMWWFGFTLGPLRLIQFVLVNFVILVGLSRVAGFEETGSRTEDLLDALAAYAVAALASAAVLLLFGVIGPGMPASEIAGKIAVQAVPASFGAMIANKQLTGQEGGDPVGSREERWRSSYAGQLFLMVAGALFLGFNVAPTEEMVLISYRMTPWHALALIAASILLLHAFVYSVGFAGQKQLHRDGMFATFIHYTLAGYGIAVLVSLYVLWTFARTSGADLPQIAMMVAVLAFPGAIGAAIARLVI